MADGKSRVLKAILLLNVVCLISFPAQAQYSGGTGEPNDPYRIATAEDLMLLGETPEDYDEHFILTADIDLDPNLPGRKVFDRAVIAPYVNDATYSSWGEPLYEGTPFTGIFEGNGHKISNFTSTSTDSDFVGIFGYVDDPNARISNLGLIDPNMNAVNGSYVGSLVGCLAE